jgi:hypothetical protein
LERAESSLPGTVALCEMDSHADTCVAGPNFRISEYTGEHCDVTPYSYDYKPMKNVPIVNASTAFTNELTGETIILQFNQVLWYGNKLKMSLMNPNQIRHFGLTVSDDPTDRTRDFGITGEDFTIPFQIKGTTIFFKSRTPTRWEMANCRTVELTVDSPWNPAEVSIAVVALSSSSAPSLEISEYRKICALDGISNHDTTEAEESDLSVFDQTTMVTRMIKAVNVATACRDPGIVGYVGAKDRHSRVTPETVARMFRCGLETAQNTSKTTTQRGVRQAIHPLHRRYRVNHLDLHRRRLHDTFFMDTLHSRVTSLGGYKCAQLITNGSFTRVYPLESKESSNIASALGEFVDDVGIPDKLICDLATEQTGKHTEVMRMIRRLHINLMPAEKGRGTTQNHRAETEIREVKTKWKTRMRQNQVPSRLWDYGLVYIAEVQSLLGRGSDNRPGIEKIMGQTVDISEWLDFDFYERVWYWDQKKMDMSSEQARLGRWLGIAHRIGSDMTYWILTEGGTVIARSTIQHITTSDMATDAMKDRVKLFDETFLTRLDDQNFHLDLPDHVFYLQDEDDLIIPTDAANIPEDSEYGDMMQPPKPEVDEFETYDQYLGAEFFVNNNGESVPAKVQKRARDNSGKPIGKRNENPLLDTRE